MDHLERLLQSNKLNDIDLLITLGQELVNKDSLTNDRLCYVILDFISKQAKDLETTIFQLKNAELIKPLLQKMNQDLYSNILHLFAVINEPTESMIVKHMQLRTKQSAFAVGIYYVKLSTDSQQSLLDSLRQYADLLPDRSEEQIFINLILTNMGQEIPWRQLGNVQEQFMTEQLIYLSQFELFKDPEQLLKHQQLKKIAYNVYKAQLNYNPKRLTELILTSDINLLVDCTEVSKCLTNTYCEHLSYLFKQKIETDADYAINEFKQFGLGPLYYLLQLEQGFVDNFKILSKLLQQQLLELQQIQFKYEKLIKIVTLPPSPMYVFNGQIKPSEEIKSFTFITTCKAEEKDDFILLKFQKDYVSLSFGSNVLMLTENAKQFAIDSIILGETYQICIQLINQMFSSQLLVFVNGQLKIKMPIKFKPLDIIKMSANVKEISISSQVLPLMCIKQLFEKRQVQQPIFDYQVANMLIKQQFLEDGVTIPQTEFTNTQIITCKNYKHESAYNSLPKSQLEIVDKCALSTEIHSNFSFKLNQPKYIEDMLYYFGQQCINQQEFGIVQLDNMTVIGKQIITVDGSSKLDIENLNITNTIQKSEQIPIYSIEQYCQEMVNRNFVISKANINIHDWFKNIDSLNESQLNKMAFYIMSSGHYFSLNVPCLLLTIKMFLEHQTQNRCYLIQQILMLIKQRILFVKDSNYTQCQIYQFQVLQERESMQQYVLILQAFQYDQFIKQYINTDLLTALTKLFSMFQFINYTDLKEQYQTILKQILSLLLTQYSTLYESIYNDSEALKKIHDQIHYMLQKEINLLELIQERYIALCVLEYYYGNNSIECNKCENLKKTAKILQQNSDITQFEKHFKIPFAPYKEMISIVFLDSIEKSISAQNLDNAVNILICLLQNEGLTSTNFTQLNINEIVFKFIQLTLAIKMGFTELVINENIQLKDEHRQQIKHQLNFYFDELFEQLLNLLKIVCWNEIIAFLLNMTAKQTLRSQLLKIHINDTIRRYRCEQMLDQDKVIEQLIQDGINTSLFKQSLNSYLLQNQEIKTIDKCEEAAAILLISSNTQKLDIIKAYISFLGHQFAQICVCDEIDSSQKQYLYQLVINIVNSNDNNSLQEFIELKSQKQCFIQMNNAINQYQVPKKYLIEQKYIEQLTEIISKCNKKEITIQQSKLQSKAEISEHYCAKQLIAQNIRTLIQQYQKQQEQILQTSDIQNSIQSRQSLRESQLRQRSFNQVLIPNQQLDNIYDNFKIELKNNINNNEIFASYFTKPIICCQVKRSIQSNLANELGILILSQEKISYIPNVRINREQKLFDQFLNQIYVHELQVKQELRTQAVCTENISYLYDPQIDVGKNNPEDILLKVLHIYPDQIQQLIGRSKSHRETGLEILTNLGYSIDFEFVDSFTQKDILNDKPAEFTRGIFLYLLNKIFKLGALCEYFVKPSVLHLNHRFYSMGDQVLVAPDASIPGLHKELQKYLRYPVNRYTAIYKQLMFSQFQNHIVLNQAQDMMNICVESVPLIKATKLIQQIKIKAMNMQKQSTFGQLMIEITNAVLKFYYAGSLTNQQFVLFLNSLSGRSPLDLAMFPIFPITKNRNLSKPIYTQTEARYLYNKVKFEQTLQMIEKEDKFGTALFQFNNDIFWSGTYPSNSAQVAHFLFRLQPYASVIVDLQNGKFDCPDRMFCAYDWLYSNVFEHGCREHVQNLLYSMKILMNLFEFNVGKRTCGKMLADVDLDLVCDQNDLAASQSEQQVQINVGLLSSKQVMQQDTDIIEDVGKNDSDDETLGLQGMEKQVSQQLSLQLSQQLPDLKESDIRPQNLFYVMLEANRQFENCSKKEILEWAQLYFGSARSNIKLGHLYPNSVYRLKITDDTHISSEIDRIQYFGVMSRKLLTGTEVILSPQVDSLRSKKDIELLPTEYPGMFTVNNQLLRVVRQEAIMNSVYTGSRLQFTYQQYKISQLSRISDQFSAKFVQNFVQILQNGVCVQIFEYPSFVQSIYVYNQLLIIVTNNAIIFYKISLFNTSIVFNICYELSDSVIYSTSLSSASGLLFIQSIKLTVFDCLNFFPLQMRALTFSEIKVNKNDYLFVRNSSKVQVYTNELMQIAQFDVLEVTNRLDFNFYPFQNFYNNTILIVTFHNNMIGVGFENSNQIINEYKTEEVIVMKDAPLHVVGNQFEQLNCETILKGSTCKYVNKYADLKMKINWKINFAKIIKDIQIQDGGEIGVQFADGSVATVIGANE
ncbi:Beige/BEACH_domain-containing protein [Hexamita inflata]|uniref:Beige/BEACH domain-containing protein n=1 Tax=Hexamita inflata TaxID=28002 RepID=A0AA86P4X9_9EUKA|nr:Beige/BEACH domain-containing protein [Hexamita inflata]